MLSSGRSLRRPRTIGAIGTVRAVGTVGTIGALGRTRSVMMVMVMPMIMAPVASITDIDAVMHRGWIAGRGAPCHADRHQARKKHNDQGYGTPHDRISCCLDRYRCWMASTAFEGSAIIAAFPSRISGFGAINSLPPRASTRAATAATSSTAI